ncbi:hypothetical protein OF829_10070 [Sphingomonas sp. LB-2]|uniref:hypothetical protein n=1 Tax=Sphingomonas caeni TaxID=2984949 RepID=UPI00222F7A9B|nr:hypothetical protein [Sphingomonas caeni]MCW3847589.1 hypothetical protein [Sphingomonas caeni]
MLAPDSKDFVRALSRAEEARRDHVTIMHAILNSEIPPLEPDEPWRQTFEQGLFKVKQQGRQWVTVESPAFFGMMTQSVIDYSNDFTSIAQLMHLAREDEEGAAKALLARLQRQRLLAANTSAALSEAAASTDRLRGLVRTLKPQLTAARKDADAKHKTDAGAVRKLEAELHALLKELEVANVRLDDASPGSKLSKGAETAKAVLWPASGGIVTNIATVFWKKQAISSSLITTKVLTKGAPAALLMALVMLAYWQYTSNTALKEARDKIEQVVAKISAISQVSQKMVVSQAVSHNLDALRDSLEAPSEASTALIVMWNAEIAKLDSAIDALRAGDPPGRIAELRQIDAAAAIWRGLSETAKKIQDSLLTAAPPPEIERIEVTPALRVVA